MYDTHTRARKSSKKYSAKAGLPMFRCGAAATDAPGRRRVPPSFSSPSPRPRPPLPGVCFESICNSLLLSRVCVATLHATFSTQANSSGNRKFEIEAPHHRSPSPPSSLFLPHPPLIIGGAPGPGTKPGGASSNSGNRMIPRVPRALCLRDSRLSSLFRYFFLVFFLASKAESLFCSTS